MCEKGEEAAQHKQKKDVSPKGVAPVRGRRLGPVGEERRIGEDAVVSIGSVGGVSSLFSGFRQCLSCGA